MDGDGELVEWNKCLSIDELASELTKCLTRRRTLQTPE
jgi:hypothetical protein